MKLKFYQNDWLGLNLAEIGCKINHNKSHIAGSKFYNEIYHQVIGQNDFTLSQSWLEKKKNISDWIGSFLRSNIPSDASILSIGCGFGVVERPLIQEGMNITLQECQTHSLQYLQKKYPEVFEKTTLIISEDLSDIPSNSFDVIISITSTYCLNQETLCSFLESVKRILKKDGIFLWYETVLSLEDVLDVAYRLVRNVPSQDRVLWGWKRSLNRQHKLAKIYGFRQRKSHYFDGNNFEIFPRKFMGIPYGNSVRWQMGIYKNDKNRC